MPSDYYKIGALPTLMIYLIKTEDKNNEFVNAKLNITLLGLEGYATKIKESNENMIINKKRKNTQENFIKKQIALTKIILRQKNLAVYSTVSVQLISFLDSGNK